MYWDASQDGPKPFAWQRARLGRQAESELLGCSLFEIAHRASSFPLHVHHANEELIVVLAGHPTLRTLDGERELERGEVVACRRGPAGAHRLDNRGDSPVRVMIVSTMIAPEVNEYPDSGKLWVRGVPPGAEGDPQALDQVARPDDSLHYLDGEV